MNIDPNQNRLVYLTIQYLSKKLGYSEKEAMEEGITKSERRAQIVTNNGEFIQIFPKAHPDNMPFVEIRDPDGLEKALEDYIQTVKEVNIKYTKMDQNHLEKYFLYNIWKNATQSDCLMPINFVKRYTEFIRDQTFSKFDEITCIGNFADNALLVKREQDDIGFETPYIIHFSLTNGRNIYHLPWVRYGICTDKNGEKIAYIYGLQQMDYSLTKEYNAQLKNEFNTLNRGLKQYRQTTPNSIAALTIFLGMLESEGITSINAPDFLGFRYGKYVHTTGDIEEQDNIQKNITNKFLRNFLRLSVQLDNLDIVSVPDQGINSFLSIDLKKFDVRSTTVNENLKKLYMLGLNSILEKKDYLNKEL